MNEYINLSIDNIENEHICCAIGDKKHQDGVNLKKEGKNGICTISSKKKKPFLSERKFFEKYGFKVVDSIGEYELLSLSFNDKEPQFSETTRKMEIETKDFTIKIIYK